MKNWIELRLFILKSISLVVGFLCNIISTKILVENFDLKAYATFATVTSIPMLLPFADIGLGLVVFNHFVLEKNLKKRQELFTRVFYATTTVAFVLGIFLLLIGISISTFSTLDTDYVGIILLIIFFTFASVPFALTYRLFQAENRMQNVVMIQSVIPIIVCLSLFVASFHNAQFSPILLIIPSATYFMTTLFSFIFFKSYRFILLRRSQLFNLNRKELTTGWISIGCVVSSILLLQVPRIILTEQRRYIPAANYSLVLLILIPATSIVSVMITQAATDIIEENLLPKRISMFTIALKKLIVVILFTLTGLLILPLITSFLQIRFIGYEIAISAAVLLLSSVPWQAAFYILTTGDYLLRQFLILSFVVFCDFLILVTFSPENLYTIVYFVLLPSNICLSIFSSWNLKRFLNRDTSALLIPRELIEE